MHGYPHTYDTAYTRHKSADDHRTIILTPPVPAPVPDPILNLSNKLR